MNLKIYEELKRVARKQEKTTYKTIASMAGLDLDIPEHWQELAKILSEISTREHHQGRPLLSAVVVLREIKMEIARPGNNFFSAARNLGLYAGHGEPADHAFFSQELSRVHEAWKKPAAGQSEMDTLF